jgi:[acyl-carrier-protein] S-malonyltransferase
VPGGADHGDLLTIELAMATQEAGLFGISAINVCDQRTAVAHLSRQLAETIHWSACMDAAAEAGISYALELGPGSALSRMLQQRHPHIRTRSVADFRTLDGILDWLARTGSSADP